MSLIVTAPVAGRDWILPRWFECLAAQTVRPDEILLLHGGTKGDPTWRAIWAGAEEHGFTVVRMHDPSPPHPRHDNERFHTLARLRNIILATAAITTSHDHLFSLDTDILLEDPESIERLLAECSSARYDVVSPLVYLHPEMRWTANAGYFSADPTVAADDPDALGDWPWKRAEVGVPAMRPIDIPMAALMMTRAVYSTVRYRWHKAGEDVGFAINLRLAGFSAGWVPEVEGKHVWDEAAFERLRAQAA